MLFNSLEFAVFFPVVTLLYFLLSQKMRVPMLLIASCWFYMAFVPVYILILGFVVLFDYTAGLYIEDARGHRRKVILVASLCANLSLLAFFKYFNFINDNLAELAHMAGWHYPIANLGILLPIGLSFHTFQSMSYTVEVYRGNQKAERSLLHFALYVMYYPQLVAGPIERPQNLLHQFREYHRFNWDRFGSGLQLMASGLFKKIIIADRLAILVNEVYANPGAHTGLQLLIATYFFAFQIYCDFSGYTDIARGASRIMGIELMLNFNYPYLATSIVDFWRRWHISLSTWFRDYLYFPLGGNRRRLPRVCLNLVIVFLISGLWHGANWTFVIWGALHGLFFVVYLTTEKWRARAATAVGLQGHFILKCLGWALTFNLVCVTWVFFRATSLSEAMLILKKIFTSLVPAGLPHLHPGLDTFQFALAILLIAALFAFELYGARKPVWARIVGQPRWVRWTTYYAFGVVFIVFLLFNPDHKPQPFIYFQF